MGKALFVTEKPSVAMDFVKLLNIKGKRNDGFIEGDKAVFTWCVGHMVTMCYPEAYNEKLRFWNLKDLPFLPKDYKYEVISGVKKQFDIVSTLLNREDIDTIYVCTDSGREGEYIYRLVDQMAGTPKKAKKRVWIDSQTEEEIKRGIREAKPLDEYDSLGDSAYLRAKEDYLLGINFSRLLTLIYGRRVSDILKEDKVVIAVGRVMSCVLGIVVDREREIRNFKKTSFYRLNGKFSKDKEESLYEGEWKSVEGSKYFESNLLYNENGFKKEEDCKKLLQELLDEGDGVVDSVKKTKETKYAPLLFNLAEIQNECSKKFKISPDETLGVIQKLYEKKLVTYPRTDARVISTAVAKGIKGNLIKLLKLPLGEDVEGYVNEILSNNWNSKILKSKYVDDSKITDHYAIIPTGEGNLQGISKREYEIYMLILKRFLAIFYPAAKYNKVQVITKIKTESFFTTKKVCVEKGYLNILKNQDNKEESNESEILNSLRKGNKIKIEDLYIKEGETTPPKRYTTGSIIIAMENAGKLIEDDELREHIKSQGIGTSATRAEIIKKLINIGYLKSNNKTQVLTPTIKGEMIYEVIKSSIPSLLNPILTASWEKGLKMVWEKEIIPDVFMGKLENYTKNNISKVMENCNLAFINRRLIEVKNIYEK
ncbi:DNA topoisomerase [Clostridium fallax]|uniref:DNA topoisomerase n=1 Tax=Clostridium fallax TaxID=1533 RepID=A0A1M4WVL9_9CLOT|nr:DNA topoisomerase [Clostridium fallax]SHE85279.1 DNA topoisomerase-3 [Clostridium fallax]SQB07431.1 DNA topoisomerase III [Clostridium fallax]